MGTTKSLHSNQNEAIEHLKRWKVGALFMEAGTGKTRTAMEIIQRTNSDFILWVTPLRTIKNLKDEVVKWGGVGTNIDYVGIESIQQSDRIFFNVLDKIQKYNHPFVIIDESLKIKNIDAKRTKRVLEIGKYAEYKLILNGTPISRNLLDIYPQMLFLSPLILDMTLNQFKNTFCRYTTITKEFNNRRMTKEYITGYENIDYLYSLIRNYVYECDLKLNIKQQYQTIYYSIDEESRDEYNRIKEKFLSDDMLEWKNNNIFLEMTQKMQHTYCCSQEKIEAVKKVFDEGIREDETIIFCKYIDSNKLCRKEFPRAKVLSYQKEAIGLNLQQYRNTIYFDKIWDLSLRVQSSRRTYRTGQEYDCKYFDLTGDVGLEKMIDKNINNKVGMLEYFKTKTKEQIKEEL